MKVIKVEPVLIQVSILPNVRVSSIKHPFVMTMLLIIGIALR